MDRRGVEEGVQVVAHLTERGRIRLWVDLRRGRRPAWLRVVSDDGTEVDRLSRAELETDTDQPHEEDPFSAPFAGLHWWDLAELAAGTSYRVEDDRETPLATFRTLPDRLPLTVVVGSCYSVDDDEPAPPGRVPRAPYRLQRLRRGVGKLISPVRALTARERRENDDAGGVAARYEALAGELQRTGRPIDVKLLLGDQVYVDQPPRKYLWPLGAPRSWRRVATRYAVTWRRLGPLLSCGTNICVSEDHEYWNNYPRRAAWLLLWREAKRDALKHAAERHRSAYQQTPTALCLQVGVDRPVRFFVADTRCQRMAAPTPDGTFMKEHDFAALLVWIGRLDGPGVLVLGQPLLAEKGNPWVDTTLANYPAQYGRLCRAISEAVHDVVVLCGDVHYGRRTVLRLESGRQLVEVVSSPMALLGSAGSAPVNVVALPPLAATDEVCSEFLQYARPNGVGEDHVTVLTFDEADEGVSLTVTPYYTRFSDACGVPLRAACWTPLVLR